MTRASINVAHQVAILPWAAFRARISSVYGILTVMIRPEAVDVKKQKESQEKKTVNTRCTAAYLINALKTPRLETFTGNDTPGGRAQSSRLSGVSSSCLGLFSRHVPNPSMHACLSNSDA